MMRNLFLVAGAAQPSPRWREAFPDALSLTQDVAITARAEADIVWLGTAAPDWEGLLAAIPRLFAGAVAVVVSNIPNEHEALRALKSGAHGYCNGWASPVQLRAVAQVVDRGGYWIGPELMSCLIKAANKKLLALEELPKELSEREAEVAREVAIGRSNKEIAASLGITERTVKAHMGAIFTKLGVRDRLQLVLRLRGGVAGEL
ncbi:MAG: response regulator transcription factor [Azoarcus sp.]|jgi:DNA-binding NarL/FixJ family response regulator|nr:response regulator transcription factor [Azoarcus sp.]